MDRRTILKTLSAAVPVSLAGCLNAEEDAPDADSDTRTDESGTRTATQTAAAATDADRAGDSRVYVHKLVDSRAHAVGTLLAHFDTDFAGRRVAVKANFNSADPFPASTHPDTLAALFDHIGDGADVVLAERSGMGETRSVLAETGVADLARQRDVDVVVLDDLDESAWTRERPADSHWTDGFLFPDVFADADAVVQTCCLKTHRYGGHFTMSLKNSVGMVAETDPSTGHDYMGELHGPDQRKKIAEVNLAYDPAFVVMDGVAGFATGGPASGERVEPGVLLASSDRVALDAVGVAVLRTFETTPAVARGPVFDQDQIARAVELGLGARRPEDVRVIPTNDAAEEICDAIRAELEA